MSLPDHPPIDSAPLREKVRVLVQLARASALLQMQDLRERAEWLEWLDAVESTIPNPREPGKPRCCSRCGQPGHKITTCTSVVVIDGWTDERVEPAAPAPLGDGVELGSRVSFLRGSGSECYPVEAIITAVGPQVVVAEYALGEGSMAREQVSRSELVLGHHRTARMSVVEHASLVASLLAARRSR